MKKKKEKPFENRHEETEELLNSCPKCFERSMEQPYATLVFPLPDYQSEFVAAQKGSEAIGDLQEIDNRLRGILKHGQPTKEVEELCEEIRSTTCKWWDT